MPREGPGSAESQGRLDGGKGIRLGVVDRSNLVGAGVPGAKSLR